MAFFSVHYLSLHGNGGEDAFFNNLLFMHFVSISLLKVAVIFFLSHRLWFFSKVKLVVNRFPANL